MNVKEIQKNISVEKVMRILAINEISGNENTICRFSFAGGISGYSFGRSQFDVKHNPGARDFLIKKCNFTQDEIQRLLNLDKNIGDLNEKLKNYRKEIDEYDLAHVKAMINHVAGLEGLPDMDEKTFIHLVDYHNQFNLEKKGKMHGWLKGKSSLTPEEIKEFKLGLKWGVENPDDVKKRWRNIEKNY